MIDPSDLEHLARAVAYRAAMGSVAPGRAQAALRVSIMAQPPAITDDVAAAYRRIMAREVDDMPPTADDLSLLVDTIAMRHGLHARADAWRIVGINPDRGRDLLTRSASAIDWPIWYTVRAYAIGQMNVTR